ncbi:hypothetical protein [Pandoraea bronchicola]|uniref:Uncharacterized protein n=1 Tax=Pandoraea bronchicola TaxID=2508287 RepID=A0A5E5BZX5_9BURK|nr:hypothetical protein [Pandoraea bronchicola]VVE90515.1 hypothetical protein PBR20603_04500 [Pandoraea bronchicola]
MIRRSLCFVVLLWSALVQAQQVDVYAGGMKSPGNRTERSYAWGFTYAQAITPHIATSFSWLNEGHVTDHHRDGFAVQLWAHQMLFGGRADLGVGVGPYRFFDTVAAGPNRAYDDRHGYGLMASTYLAWYITWNWSITLRANWVRAGSSIDTSSYVVGLGYRFGSAPGGVSPSRRNTETGHGVVSVYSGLSVVNSLTSQNARAYSFEYRREVAEWLDASLALIDEGCSDIGHRQGMAAQLWLKHGFFDDRLQLSLGFGPYVTWSRYDTNPEAAGRQNVVAALLTMSASYRLSPRWIARASWARVVSGFDRDSDIFLAGIGYRY